MSGTPLMEFVKVARLRLSLMKSVELVERGLRRERMGSVSALRESL